MLPMVGDWGIKAARRSQSSPAMMLANQSLPVHKLSCAWNPWIQLTLVIQSCMSWHVSQTLEAVLRQGTRIMMQEATSLSVSLLLSSSLATSTVSHQHLITAREVTSKETAVIKFMNMSFHSHGWEMPAHHRPSWEFFFEFHLLRIQQ